MTPPQPCDFSLNFILHRGLFGNLRSGCRVGGFPCNFSLVSFPEPQSAAVPTMCCGQKFSPAHLRGATNPGSGPAFTCPPPSPSPPPPHPGGEAAARALQTSRAGQPSEPVHLTDLLVQGHPNRFSHFQARPRVDFSISLFSVYLSIRS